MSFMEHEITGKQLWYAVDGNGGLDYIPADVAPFSKGFPMGRVIDDNYPRLFAALCEAVRDYTEITGIYNITLEERYGARVSTPGYTDCTAWVVFATAEEAQEYLNEYYPNDDEEGE